MASGRFVAYYNQQSSGLEAQQAAVEKLLGAGNWRLCRQYVEVDSGKPRHYPGLAKALNARRSYNATLIITQLARGTNRKWQQLYLGPNPILIPVRDAGVDFFCIDKPEVNKRTIHALAEQAEQVEQERDRVLTEHRESIRQYFIQLARGRVTTRMRNVESGRLRWASRTRNYPDWKRRVRPLIDQIRASGIVTLPGIAEELNRRGEVTSWGSQWTTTQVHRLLKHTPAA